MRNNIRALMDRENIQSINALAIKCGLPRCTVRAWERGYKIPNLFNAHIIAHALNASIDEVFSLTSEEKDYIERLPKNHEK